MYDDFCQTCSLIATTETSVDGVLTVTETSSTVFCAVISNIHSLKTEAGSTGTGYELKLKLSDSTEYNNEKFVVFNGDRYEVTRVYYNGDLVELTMTRGVR